MNLNRVSEICRVTTKIKYFPKAFLVRKRFVAFASQGTSSVFHHSLLHTDPPLLCKPQIRFWFPIYAASFGVHDPEVCRTTALKQINIRCSKRIAESRFGLSMKLTNVLNLDVSDLHAGEILGDGKLHAKSNSMSDSCLVTWLVMPPGCCA